MTQSLRPLKILYVCSARDLGGGERHLRDLAHALHKRGHDIFVALIPNSPLLHELSDLPTDNLIQLPLRSVAAVSSTPKLVRFMKNHQIDIIHAHMGRDYPLAAFVARSAGKDLIVTRHVLFQLKRAHRFTLSNVSRVI